MTMKKWNEILTDKNRRQYICKMCHTDIQTQFKCVCCKLKYDTHLCKDYNSTDYDFTHFIVSWCLQYVDSEVQSYICLSCHRGLQKTNDENPTVPYYVNNKAITIAAKFLKSLQDKPEYVNVNTNLYSTLGGTPSSYQLHFTIAAAKANHHSVSHQYEREPPSPRSTPWGAYRSASHFVQYT